MRLCCFSHLYWVTAPTHFTRKWHKRKEHRNGGAYHKKQFSPWKNYCSQKRVMYRKKRWWQVLWIIWHTNNRQPWLSSGKVLLLSLLPFGKINRWYFFHQASWVSFRPLAPPSGSLWLTQEAQVTVTLQLTRRKSGEELLPVTIILRLFEGFTDKLIISLLQRRSFSWQNCHTKVMLWHRRCVRLSCSHTLSTVTDWSCQRNTEINRDLHFWTGSSYSVSSPPPALVDLLSESVADSRELLPLWPQTPGA